jgi:hypothetical protein
MSSLLFACALITLVAPHDRPGEAPKTEDFKAHGM